MKRQLFLAALFFLIQVAHSQNITVDVAKKYQVIRGFGVNANPQSWNVNPGAVKKVVDMLVDSLECTSFRLMFDDCDWEQVNDNGDPDVYNWNYYDSLYSTPRFTGIWEMIAYLNSKGITDITLSPDGAGPKWMGGTTLQQGKEAEYAEMINSMVCYGRKRLQPAVQFSRLSPINESTCGGGEGVVTTPDQFGRLYHMIAVRLKKDSLDDLTIIGPDDCGGWSDNFHEMLNDSIIMSKVKFFGQHDYGNSTNKAREMVDGVQHSAYPNREVFMTEVNAVCKNCDGGVYNADYGFNAYAGPAYQYILQDLNAGVNGIQVWEAYDSRYHHPNRYLTWSMWGIFAVNDTSRPDVYTKRAHFYVLRQLFNFVKPGFRRIEASTTLHNVTLSAFTDPVNGRIVITGINNSDRPQTINCNLLHIGARKWKYYFSDQSHHFEAGPDADGVKGRITGRIPANSVFTFVGD